MLQALQAGAQPSLDVSAPRSARPLTFSNSPSGSVYMATFRDHVFCIRRHKCTDRAIWSTTITEFGCETGAANAFGELGDAIDHLQREAVRLGAQSAPGAHGQVGKSEADAERPYQGGAA